VIDFLAAFSPLRGSVCFLEQTPQAGYNSTMLQTAFLCLGSNLGDRLANLHQAILLLSPKAATIRASAVYETEPWGYKDQPSFLNQVIEVQTELNPQELLFYVQDIEKKVGRKPSFRYGPRVIDVDILLYDDVLADTPELIIPHPHLQERAFALVPLVEIAPDLVIPGLGIKVRDLLVKLEPSGVKRLSEPQIRESCDHEKR
jgi:2-amino-4-hydroxy-6-hydroxymethyldihydropteridine diphosphokinase